MKKLCAILLICLFATTAHASYWKKITQWDGVDPVISVDTTAGGQGAGFTAGHGWDGLAWQKISSDSLGRQKTIGYGSSDGGTTIHVLSMDTTGNPNNNIYGWNNTNWEKVSADSSGRLQIKIVDDRFAGYARIDGSTESLQVIDYEHHEVHSGSSYFFDGFTDVAQSAMVDYVLSTGNSTRQSHVIFTVATESESTFTIFEDSTVADDGTALTIFNNNRNSGNNTINFLSRDSTHTVEGTVLLVGKTGSGKQEGGEVGRAGEFVLAPNIKYVFRISNDAATTSWADFEINFYEHEPRN